MDGRMDGWTDTQTDRQISLSLFVMLPPQHTTAQTAGNHGLIEHLQELPTDVKGPQPPQEVEPALPLPVQDVCVG